MHCNENTSKVQLLSRFCMSIYVKDPNITDFFLLDSLLRMCVENCGMISEHLLCSQAALNQGKYPDYDCQKLQKSDENEVVIKFGLINN